MKTLSKKLHPRIAVYTHDTFGLGHIRRCLNIIQALTNEHPDVAVLLVTGSSALSFFKDLPQNVDYLKIPTIVKTGKSGAQPSHLPIGSAQVTLLRKRLIREAIASFQPDIFLVDNFPLGSHSELLELLLDLKNSPTKTILGLRDILNGPEIVKAKWKRKGIFDILDNYYDKILIYGEQQVFDAIDAYEIPPQVAKKVHYCGYITSPTPLPQNPEDIRKELGIKGPLILATGGGGGDAYPLLSSFLESISRFPDSTGLVFTGPLMGKQDREQLQNLISGYSNVILKDFVLDLRAYLKAADVVVSMFGYNMASEIVCQGVRAVVCPRTWHYGEHAKRHEVNEEKEQYIRAKKFEQFGLIHYLDPGNLNANTLADKISHALTHPKPKAHVLNLEGVHTAVEHIMEECNETV